MNHLCGPVRNVNDNLKNRNQPHSCGDFSIEKVFEKVPTNIFLLFNKIHNKVVSLGDMNVYPVKNGVMYSVNSTFLALKPHNNYLAVEFVSNQEHDEFPVEKTVWTSKNEVAHILKIDSEDNIDQQLTDWIKNAYIHNNSKRKGNKL